MAEEDKKTLARFPSLHRGTSPYRVSALSYTSGTKYSKIHIYAICFSSISLHPYLLLLTDTYQGTPECRPHLLSSKPIQVPVPLLLTSLFPPSPVSKQASSPLYWQHLYFILLPSTLLPTPGSPYGSLWLAASCRARRSSPGLSQSQQASDTLII